MTYEELEIELRYFIPSCYEATPTPGAYVLKQALYSRYAAYHVRCQTANPYTPERTPPASPKTFFTAITGAIAVAFPDATHGRPFVDGRLLAGAYKGIRAKPDLSKEETPEYYAEEAAKRAAEAKPKPYGDL